MADDELIKKFGGVTLEQRDCYKLFVDRKEIKEVTNVSWDELPLIGKTRCIIRKNDTDVIRLAHHGGDPLVAFHGHRFGVKILTLADTVSFLKTGFADIYKKFSKQVVNEMKPDDELFQQFVFVKMLNYHKRLDRFFDVCLCEDEDSLYKIWMHTASGKCDMEVANVLRMNHESMIVREKDVEFRRSYTKPAKETWQMGDKKGSDLSQKLTDLAKPETKTKLTFTIGDKSIFKINWKGEGNGTITFDPDEEKVSPRWEILSRKTLKHGFATTYNNYMNNPLGDTETNVLSSDRNFQAFVLLQFEIARRSESSSPENGLKRDEIQKGVNTAVKIDKQKYYEYMTKMFMGDRRREYYQLLLGRFIFEERLKRAEKDIDGKTTSSKEVQNPESLLPTVLQSV